MEHLAFLGKVSSTCAFDDVDDEIVKKSLHKSTILFLLGYARHRNENHAVFGNYPRVYERIDTVERQLHQMYFASTDDFQLDRQSVGCDILAVSVGKVAGLHSR